MEKRNKKRIYIYAYTEMNVGDDLFVKMLCERYANTKFYIFSAKNTSKAFSNIKNLKVLPLIPYVDGIFRRCKINFSINSYIQKIVSLYCDAIVNIGGSLFIETNRWKFDIISYKKRLVKDKPYFIIGSNFGPYQNETFYDSYKELFSQVTDICFREKYSYNMFSNLNNVRYAQDVIFSYSNENLKKSTYNTKTVLFSIMNFEKHEKLVQFYKDYEEKMIDLIKLFIKDNYEINLVGFCKKENDEKVIKRILDSLDKNEKVFSYIYDGNLEKIIDLINQSNYIISTRFHAMILGWVMGKKVYPVIYSNKTLNVINDMNFKGRYINIEDISHMEVQETYDYLINSSPINIETEIKMAEIQFSALDKFIDGNNKIKGRYK